MNPYANAALNASEPPEGNPRRSEAWALTEAGRRLALASRADVGAMREALRLNWRLWTIFQADLTSLLEPDAGGNVPTPGEVTLNMLTLCQFIDKHTVAALSDPTPDKLQVLIDINRNIAAGLMESLAQEAKGVADSSPPLERLGPVSAYG
jgi:flagellar protein FlaF